MTTESDTDLTPDQLAFVREPVARWRMNEAGPLMLGALRRAEAVLVKVIPALQSNIYCYTWQETKDALESVRAAIAAAE